MPEVDIRTLLLTTGLVVLVIAAYLVYFRFVSDSLEGVGCWALGALCGGLGLLLIGLRSLLPDWLSVVAANLLVALFAVLVWVGLSRFLGLRARRWPHALVMALLAAGFVHWTYASPSVNARIALISLLVAGYCLGCGWMVLRRAPGITGARNWLLVFCFWVMALVHGVRVAHVWLAKRELASLVDVGAIHALGFLAFAGVAFLITTGLVFLGIKRMEHDLGQARAELRQLGGLLPICASCKRIRDDRGYWHQVESYIKSHSEADFTHGICPECMRRLYPEVAPDVLDRPEGQAGGGQGPSPDPAARP